MNIRQALKERIMILDGAMGSLIQNYKFEEDDFRGEILKNHPNNIKGNNDILSLTQPHIISQIHQDYLKAGADIIETNTLIANSISQTGYQLEQYIYEMNKASAQLAKEACLKYTTSYKPRFVAGSIGPTSKTASLSPDINQPAFREVTFDILKESYLEQIRGLIDGGVDLLLIETVFDLINCKAAYFAAKEALKKRNLYLPIMISITISPQNGRVLSGHTLEAFYNTFASHDLLSFGLNCSSGARDLFPFVKELDKYSSFYLSLYPNAGIPDEFGNYRENPSTMVSYFTPLLEDQCINILGGCCGTTPEHIKEIANTVKDFSPRKPPPKDSTIRLSGLEPVNIHHDSNFINISERTNVAGSKKFANYIKNKKYSQALAIAHQQITKGSQILDINMDDPLINSAHEMQHFLNLINSDPDIAKVPIMIDSSDWSVIQAGLKCLSGKGIVNSISLKNGEEDFLNKAEIIREYGAAVVIMAFDEHGQAVDFEHKAKICQRSYDLLIKKLKFSAQDIIFDPNILTIGTGIKEHNNYANDYLKAVSWITENLPRCSVSGGISNLSFAFRGNDLLREAMHSVFLFYAIKNGLKMGIVNAGKLPSFEDINPQLKEHISNLIFNKSPQATDQLLNFLENFTDQRKRAEAEETEEWRKKDIDSRIKYSLIRGNIKYLDQDCIEIIKKYEDPVTIIEGPVMEAVNQVGELFGSGKMFLPQVVKTARVMKRIVDYLLPHFGKSKDLKAKAGKILLATVKGDVHDIGKNIAGIVLGCNNYEIIDLGVGTSANKIIHTALKKNVDIIGLSGLITPSLNEMIHVVKEMKKSGLKIPVIIGGATTSKPHTALKIAPQTYGPVVYAKDASAGIRLSNLLMNKEKRKSFLKELNKEYQAIRLQISKKDLHSDIIPYPEVNNKKPLLTFNHDIKKPQFLGNQTFLNYMVSDICNYINWQYFFIPWGFKGKFPNLLKDGQKGIKAQQLYDDARSMLDEMKEDNILKPVAVVGFYQVNSDQNNIINIFSPDDPKKLTCRIPCLRQQQLKNDDVYLSLSDYIAPERLHITDYIGLFTLSCSQGSEYYINKFQEQDNYYSVLIVQELINRLTEAFSEFLHQKVRKELWGYMPKEDLSINKLFRNQYQGIRPAPGYSAIPDHSIKEDLFSLLNIQHTLNLNLTENYMINPSFSIAGIYLSHPQSKYFSINSISQDQYVQYIKNRNKEEKEIKKSLITLLL